MLATARPSFLNQADILHLRIYWNDFTTFSLNGRYLFEFLSIPIPFSDFSRDVAMATMGKIGELTFIQHARIQNEYEYRNSDL